MELQKPGNKQQKTTANDGGRTSPTSCRQDASNKPVFINNNFTIQSKAILFTVVTEADVELEKPGNQLQSQRQTMGDELVQHLADKNLCFTEVSTSQRCRCSFDAFSSNTKSYESNMERTRAHDVDDEPVLLLA